MFSPHYQIFGNNSSNRVNITVDKVLVLRIKVQHWRSRKIYLSSRGRKGRQLEFGSDIRSVEMKYKCGLWKKTWLRKKLYSYIYIIFLCTCVSNQTIHSAKPVTHPQASLNKEATSEKFNYQNQIQYSHLNHCVNTKLRWMIWYKIVVPNNVECHLRLI